MNDNDRSDDLRRRAASGVRWIGAATAVRVTVQVAQLFVLARLLVPEDFGLMALVTVVVALGQAVADAGVSNAIVHYQDATRRELSSLYWLNLSAGAVVFVLAWLSIPACVALWDEPRVADLIRLASLAFLITPLGLQFQVLLERELRFRALALIETVAAVAGFAVGVALALQGQGVYSLVWAMLAFVILRAALLAGTGLRSWRPHARFRWSDCRRFLRFGVFQMSDRVLNQLSAQMDRIIIGAVIGTRPLGFYNVSHELSRRPFLVLNPVVTRVAFPVFARVQADDSRLRAGFLRVIEALAAVMGPLYVALIVLAEPVIHVGAGPGWEASVPLLRVLGGVGLVLSLGNPMGSLLLAKGRAGMAFSMNLCRIVLDVAAIWLAARHGAIMVAWAILAVRLGVMFPLGFLVRWVLVRMRPGEYFGAIGATLMASAFMGAVMLALVELVPWPGELTRLLACLAAGVLVYVATMRVFQPERVRRLWASIRP